MTATLGLTADQIELLRAIPIHGSFLPRRRRRPRYAGHCPSRPCRCSGARFPSADFRKSSTVRRARCESGWQLCFRSTCTDQYKLTW